jgi:uncharacterized protein YegP (UPF0339 family)
MVNIWIQDSADGQFFFTIVGKNYERLAHSETYRYKSDCKSTAELIKREAGSASILDLTKSKV